MNIVRKIGLMTAVFMAAGLLIVAGNTLYAHPSKAVAPQAVADKIAAAQVPFIKNEGQIANENVQFYAKMFAGTLFVTRENRLVYSLPCYGEEGIRARWSFSESFAGRNKTSSQVSQESSGRVSWFKGNHPGAWKKQLPTYSSVDLGELYPGIRVSLKAAGNNVEKLFFVSPGADPKDIKIKVEGVPSLGLDAKGQLVLKTTLGDIHFSAPVAYQMVDGKRQPVEVAYALADGQYRFEVGKYDKTEELVIDPLLASTYLGGRNPDIYVIGGVYDDDFIYSIATADDSIYVAGVTQSPDFPIFLGYDDSYVGTAPDGFITRMSSDLSTVLASTYIGTSSFDRVAAIAVDANGEIVATGQAGGGFPITEGAYTHGGTGGGFIARLSADLSTLVASSVVTPSDYPRKLTLGNNGVYFGGGTNYPGMPVTPDAYDTTCGYDGACDPSGSFYIPQYYGFAGKLSSDLSTLEALTYLDHGKLVSGISVAPDGSVFIADGEDNEITGYLARFDGGLTTRMAYLTYYPGSHSGSSRTYFNAVAAGDGYVIAAGQTYMYDLPATEGAFDTTCGTDGVCDGVGELLVPQSDGFIAKYSYDLQETLALTFLGGSDHESIRTIALDADGTVYVAGETRSTDFPTTDNAADPDCGTDGLCNPAGAYSPIPDGFAARLSPDLSTLEYGTYLGGSDDDHPMAIALGAAGQTYVAGFTRSNDFPTTAGAFDRTYAGGSSDAFISAYDMEIGVYNKPPVADAGRDRLVRAGMFVFLDGRGALDPDGSIVEYRWRQIHGETVSILKPTGQVGLFVAPTPGSGSFYELLLFQQEVTDDLGAKSTDEVRVFVVR